MLSPRMLALHLVGVWITFTTAAAAATVTWSAPTTILGDTDVRIDGVLDRAFNLGSAFAPVATTTVNGVPFAFFGGDDSGSVTVGNTTLSGPSVSGANAFGSALPPFSLLGANYRSLLENAIFASGTDTLTLTLNGLTDGQPYLFQWWVNDSRLAAGPNRQGTSTAGNAVQLEYNVQNTEGGVGQYVVGTFTATGTTQVIAFTGQSDGPPGAAPQINAFQLRAVPEPSSLLLLLAGSAFLRRRRPRA